MILVTLALIILGIFLILENLNLYTLLYIITCVRMRDKLPVYTQVSFEYRKVLIPTANGVISRNDGNFSLRPRTYGWSGLIEIPYVYAVALEPSDDLERDYLLNELVNLNPHHYSGITNTLAHLEKPDRISFMLTTVPMGWKYVGETSFEYIRTSTMLPSDCIGFDEFMASRIN